ncbi:MAG TPA: hypothetical protein VIW93_01885 [Candidatus Acidoferrum sp.]
MSDVAILQFPADGKILYGTQRSRPAWNAVSAAFTSLLIGAVLVYGVPVVFALLAVAMILVAAVVGFMGSRTNGMVLEELSR